jgi:hypothetical protein
MKPFLDKIVKTFLKYRDWLVVAILVGGIVFFVQKTQGVKEQDPGALWQIRYGEQVRPPEPQPIPGDIANTGDPAAPPPGDPTASPPDRPMGDPGSTDLFAEMDLDEISSISYNPIFTPAENYADLVGRLKQLRTDFQDAQDKGDIKTAISKLEAYEALDPHGVLLDGWTTAPAQMLKNLVCSELINSIESALSSAKEARAQANSTAQAEPYKALDMIQKAFTSVDRCLQDVDKNAQCLEDPRISDGERVTSLRQMREQIEEEQKALNQKLIRQEYDAVVQQAGAIGADAGAEQVAKVIKAIQEFRTLVERQGEGVLNQTQIDRLSDIQSKVEGNKESLVSQVEQQIDQIAQDPNAATDLDKINDILRQFDILKLLGEPESKIAQKRREWENSAHQLEAVAQAEEMQTVLDEISTKMDQLDTLLAAREDTTDLFAKIGADFTRLEAIKKNTKLKRDLPSLRKISADTKKLKARFTAQGRKR